ERSHHRARCPVLHRQFSGWLVERKERCYLWKALGLLSGDAAFPRLSEPAGVSYCRPEPWRNVHLPDVLSIRRALTGVLCKHGPDWFENGLFRCCFSAIGLY